MNSKITRRIVLGTLVGLMGAALSVQAQAQTVPWPKAQPIRLVVGFAPGGPTDLVARVIANQMSDQLGTPVTVLNRPGANGNIAANLVAKSAPDGYTFLYNSSSLSVSPAIYKDLPFDLDKDLTFVGATVAMPSVLVVPANSPAKDFPAWIEQLKQHGKALNYGSPGVGNSSHLAMEVILKAFGVQATHVPYKGSADARTALLGGQTQFQIDSINAALPHIKEGRLRAIAVLSKQRAVDLPDVPTISESGIPGFEDNTWQGVVAPAGTPPAIVDAMSAALAKAIASPAVKATLVQQGAFSISSSPADYDTYVKKERDRYIKIVQDMGVKLN